VHFKNQRALIVQRRWCPRNRGVYGPADRSLIARHAGKSIQPTPSADPWHGWTPPSPALYVTGWRVTCSDFPGKGNPIPRGDAARPPGTEPASD